MRHLWKTYRVPQFHTAQGCHLNSSTPGFSPSPQEEDGPRLQVSTAPGMAAALLTCSVSNLVESLAAFPSVSLKQIFRAALLGQRGNGAYTWLCPPVGLAVESCPSHHCVRWALLHT